MALADVNFHPQDADVDAQLKKETTAMHEQNQKQQLAFQNINRTLQDILAINSKLVEKKEQLHRMVSQQDAAGLLQGFQDNTDGQLPHRPVAGHPCQPYHYEGSVGRPIDALQGVCENAPNGGTLPGHVWPTHSHQLQEPSPTMQEAVDINNARWLHALEEAAKQGAPKHTTAASKPQEGKLGVNRPLRDMPPGTTTLCIRNIPSRYSMDQLLREFVVDGSFNLIHRPFNSNGNKKVGYVFINFVTPEAALRFQHRWHGKFLENHGPTRALDVTSATIQGYEATLLPFTKRMLEFTDASQLPVTFRGTKRLDTMQEAARLARLSEGKRQ